ncbi:SDR family NAD(P)-dependent oxidoreductase [Carboxylicivirga sp. M1479]|uniref:SDR family NAD(P)-dependent oxidoreductase n=1 Tax=Carboxylicivirga sp. M1479 TaxID=2594476 RepID=UPI00117784C7|nr:SDR family oxidoreductase [Carboxylicivirga sp. M1479]TRX71156.1 SDR family oxidoreductase [Carboxylicivirga sp. M1479]
MIPIDLEGKVAIVTGSTQGIGLGISKMLAKAGCHIAGCGLCFEDSSKVANFNEAIHMAGKRAFYQTVDVKIKTELDQFVENVVKEFGQIDMLVSNAGKNMFVAPENCEESFWDENESLNLKSHWLISKACYPYLKKQQGTIVLMSSNHAYTTLPNCFPYNVTKAGITGMVNALAVQWGSNVRVVGLAPGFIETEGGDEWFNSFPNPEEKRKEVLSIHPTKKLGTPEEIGAFCTFLCSDFAGFITGVTYLMDGGRSALMQDI